MEWYEDEEQYRIVENVYGEQEFIQIQKPTDYQAEGTDQILNRLNGRALLADPMGVGKTLQAINCLKLGRRYLPAVVLCPSIVKYNWAREIEYNLGIKPLVLEGTKSYFLEDPPEIIILNYDILRAWLGTLIHMKPRTLIMDECHVLAHLESRRTQYVKRLCEGAKIKNRIGLSGTPLQNYREELYPMLNILRPDLFDNFDLFVKEFCGDNLNSKLFRILKDVLMIRRRKEDVIPKTYNVHRDVHLVQLADKPAYDACFNDFKAWITIQGDLNLTNTGAFAKTAALRKLCGKLKIPAIIRWLDRWLMENDGKIIVFGIHSSVVLGLYNYYRDKAVLINGPKTATQRQRAVDRFNDDPTIRIMVGNIESCGVGWNGTIANTNLIVELPWSPGKIEQAEARTDRKGQTRDVTTHYLLAEGTIETRISKLLFSKSNTINAVIDGVEMEEVIYAEFLRVLRAEEKNDGGSLFARLFGKW